MEQDADAGVEVVRGDEIGFEVSVEIAEGDGEGTDSSHEWGGVCEPALDGRRRGHRL